jgi:hypothetical protein
MNLIDKDFDRRKSLIEFFVARKISRPNTTNYLNKKVKLFGEYGNLCMCCGEKRYLTIDHIYPKSLYPEYTNNPNNLQLLCVTCNNEKGVLLVDFRPYGIKLKPTYTELKAYLSKYLHTKHKTYKGYTALTRELKFLEIKVSKKVCVGFGKSSKQNAKRRIKKIKAALKKLK